LRSPAESLLPIREIGEMELIGVAFAVWEKSACRKRSTFAPLAFAVDDRRWRVRIEIMTRLEVRANEQDHFAFRIDRELGRSSSHPELINLSRLEDEQMFGVRVMASMPPGREDAFGKTVLRRGARRDT